MIKEFKEFIMRGSLIDMAIGLVMGAAFAKVTDVFVGGIFNPLVGLIFQTSSLDAVVVQVGEAKLAVGQFIGAIINFVIVGFVMFMVIKAVNKMKRKQEAEAPAAPPAPSAQETLLAEIRDLLKK